MTQITPTDRSMDLILKPTEMCNFACTFCSSSKIAANHKDKMDHEYIFNFLRRYPKTRTIIINGGDPLMMPPKWYWKIIEFLDEHEMPATLSFTTNLWSFYQNPKLWVDLFKHKRVGIGTSFNYGDGRRITLERIFTEEIFWKVSDTFLEHIGYRPSFISVVTGDEDEETIIDNVRLAKKMGVVCKLNYAQASGRQKDPFVPSKLWKIYLRIHDLGLMEWESNTKQILSGLSEATICPLARDCDEHIRAINPNGDMYSCGSFADDQDKAIDYEDEIFNGNMARPLATDPELHALKSECYSCPMFTLCNGCRKTIKDLKQANAVETHCTQMKEIAPRIIELNFVGQSDEIARQQRLV